MRPEPKAASLFAMPSSVALSDQQITPLVLAALEEDLGHAGDVTTKALIDPHLQAKGTILAKQDGVVCGLRCAALAFRLLEETAIFTPLAEDGTFVKAGTAIAHIETSARTLLTGERTALNFLGRLSGIATLTKKFVDEISHTRARICDTRKTAPGLRSLEKYAVACGGGTNHRLGLYDAILIKDNHVALAGGIKPALQKAQAASDPYLQIEIEVDTLAQLEEALEAGAKRILLDNMDVATLQKAVQLTKGRAVLEASGGVTLANVKTIAATGVDLISCGALTHSAPNFDVSLEIDV